MQCLYNLLLLFKQGCRCRLRYMHYYMYTWVMMTCFVTADIPFYSKTDNTEVACICEYVLCVWGVSGEGAVCDYIQACLSIQYRSVREHTRTLPPYRSFPLILSSKTLIRKQHDFDHQQQHSSSTSATCLLTPPIIPSSLEPPKHIYKCTHTHLQR